MFNAGEEDLTFSFQEGKKYIAQVVNNIDFTLTYKYISSFPIVFNCRPFKYSNENELITLTESQATINSTTKLAVVVVICIYNITKADGQLFKIYNIGKDSKIKLMEMEVL